MSESHAANIIPKDHILRQIIDQNVWNFLQIYLFSQQYSYISLSRGNLIYFCHTYLSTNIIFFLQDANLLKLLQCRGPDIYKNVILNINENDSNSNNTIEMCGCTLWMQGSEPHVQPIDSDRGTLLFNGDLFNTEWVGDSCDTQVLYERLKSNVSIKQ